MEPELGSGITYILGNADAFESQLNKALLTISIGDILSRVNLVLSSLSSSSFNGTIATQVRFLL